MQTISGGDMTFLIHARDAAGRITLRRETREAAEKKAEELRQMGCFDVEIVDEAEPKAA
jgi:hypothetical protein